MSDKNNDKKMLREAQMQSNRKSFRNLMKITLSLVLILSLIVFLGYSFLEKYYNKMKIDREDIEHNVTTASPKKESLEDKKEIEEVKKEKKINILLMGTDRGGYLTDSILLIHYNTLSKSTSLVSIPRDYKIELSKEVQKKIRYHAKYIKITELNSYAKSAGEKSSFSYTAKAIEEMLDLKIDHVVLFEIPAFRKVVDSVGGVEIFVPQNYRYDDPTQNLHINLKKGLQTLNGRQAEGLVRYRQNNAHKGYGDFGRMEIQQYFLTAFLKKAMSIESVLNFKEISESISDFINTDASFSEALSLLNIFKDADMKRIFSHTLPGSHRIIDEKYFYEPPENSELIKIVEEWFSIDSSTGKNSKKFKIYIKNSSNSREVCDKIVSRLNSDGYEVVYLGDYSGYTIKSQIIVNDIGVGLDLKKYLNLSEYKIDKNILEKELSKEILKSEEENSDEFDKSLKNSILIIVGKVEQ